MRIMMMVVMIVHTHMLGEAEGIIKYPLERTLPNYFINFVHIQRGRERGRAREIENNFFGVLRLIIFAKGLKTHCSQEKEVKIALINLNCLRSGASNS